MKIKTNSGASKKKMLNAVRLEFHDENARIVRIAGTFNDWNPERTPMLTTAPGQWIKDLSLRPGIYEYQYVVDGKWINDPQAVKSTPNPYGGRKPGVGGRAKNTKQGKDTPPGGPAAQTPREERGD